MLRLWKWPRLSLVGENEAASVHMCLLFVKEVFAARIRSILPHIWGKTGQFARFYLHFNFFFSSDTFIPRAQDVFTYFKG